MSNQIPSCCSEKLVWLLDENNGNANGCFGLLKFVRFNLRNFLWGWGLYHCIWLC